MASNNENAKPAAGLAASPLAINWLADATLVVHSVKAPQMVPWGPSADEMWEWGRLCTNRLNMVLKVQRLATRQGHSIEERLQNPQRQFRFGERTMETWEDAIAFEAVVGPLFRLFFESFLKSQDEDVREVAHYLWEQSQLLIRFGQVRIAEDSAGAVRQPQLKAAVEKWLAGAIDAVADFPQELDVTCRKAGLKHNSNEEIWDNYSEEIVSYLNANDIDIPASLRDEFVAAEVNWLGDDIVQNSASVDGQELKPATFAFSEKERGRKTASASAGDESAGDRPHSGPKSEPT